MTLLSSLTSDHEELQQIITAVWGFATLGGLNAIERDDAKMRKVRTFGEVKSVFDQTAMNAMGEAALFTLAEVNKELEEFARKKPKASRAQLGEFVITTIIREAFWQKRTAELLWMLGLQVVDKSAMAQLVQHHAKVVDNLARDPLQAEANKN